MTSKEKYEEEVDRMTRRYEMINKRAKTIVRKPTQEELKFYEEILEKNDKPNYIGDLTYLKEGNVI